MNSKPWPVTNNDVVAYLKYVTVSTGVMSDRRDHGYMGSVHTDRAFFKLRGSDSLPVSEQTHTPGRLLYLVH